MNLRRRKIMFSMLILFFWGCQGQYKLDLAKKHEAKGEIQKAWETYQEFAAKNPRHEAAPEAIFRAGWLAQKYLGDCVVAKSFYDQVVQNYPQAPTWARQAAYYRNNCPDYFPLTDGFQWVEGDSETHGKNARIEIAARVSPSKEMKDTTGIVTKTYFAGENKFKAFELVYKKTDTEVMEFSSKQDPRYKTILMWPLEKGNRWNTKYDNKIFRYEIAAIDKTINVVAGEFFNCLQIQSSIDGYPGLTNEYYAPEVGRVLVSISTPNGEKRNTELLSYRTKKEDVPAETKNK